MTEKQSSQTDNKRIPIQTISLLSGFLWIFTGLVVIYVFQPEETAAGLLLKGKITIIFQLISGTAAGIVFGYAGIRLLRLPRMKAILDDYPIIQQVRELNLSARQIVLISVIAGISEEFLFRAAIQPVLGIWLTSLLFIGIHGYIRFRTTGHLLFTLFTFVLSTVLGLLFIGPGLISAMAAHAVYDMIVLWKLRKGV